MNYQTTATPITTEAEFDAAKAAGACIEYTACDDEYDLPPCESGSGGWIPTDEFTTEGQTALSPGERLRAFYPITSAEGPEA